MEPTPETVIAQILNDFSPASPASTAVVTESGELVNYERAELIFQEKKYNAFEYFVIEGIAHRYNVDAEGQPTTTGIFIGPTVIIPHFARTINGQSIFSLQALTQCTFFKIPIGTFDDLRSKYEQIRAFG